MRLLLYNIRYATGTGAAFHLPVPGAGYLRSNPRVLEGITRFIKSADPDIVGLVEVDTGSFRTGRVNQAEVIAEALGHYSTYQCKYGTDSLNTLVPIVNKQAAIMLKAAEDPRVLKDPAPRVYTTDLAESSVQMLMRCWVQSSDWWETKNALTEQVKLSLDAAGIEIPYTKLDINLVRTKKAPAGSQV